MTYTSLIDRATAAKLIAAPGVAVIDCRFDLAAPAAGRQAFLTGHIPGALYADLQLDLSAPITSTSGRHPLPAPAVFADWAGAHGIGEGSQVIAYDSGNGAFAARLWWILRWLGHRQAAVLDGGYAAWVEAGGAVQVEERPGGPPQFHASTRSRRRTDQPASRRGLEGYATVIGGRACFRAIRGQSRTLGPGGRSCSRRTKLSVRAESRSRRPVSTAGRTAAPLARVPGRRAAGRGHCDVRFGRHRLSQPARARGGGSWGRRALPRLMERMDCRSRASGRHRQRAVAAPPSGRRKPSFTCPRNLLWCAPNEHDRKDAAFGPPVEDR